MRAGIALVVVTACAVGTGYLGGTLFNSGRDARPDAEVAALERRIETLEATRAPNVEPESASEPTRAAVEARRRQQDRRIEAVRANVATLADVAGVDAASTGAPPSPLAPAPPDVDPDVRRLQALPDPELRAEVKRLSVKAFTPPVSILDADALLKTCDVLLAREIDASERADTLLEKGRAHLVLKDPASAESACRASIDAAGAASAKGRVATWQLALVVQRRDPRAAADLFVGAANCPEASLHERTFYRFAAGNCLASAGDAAGARAQYRGVIDEFGGSDDVNAKRNVESCRAALAKLDGIESVETPSGGSPVRPPR